MDNIDKAYDFYSKHIYDKEKIKLLREYNLKTAGFVPSVLWELFGALITGKKGTGLTGADLEGWEVKSSVERGSFEYQYHLNTGRPKLIEDCGVSHLFCSYSKDYKNVFVRMMTGEELRESYFDKWLPEYELNYDRSIESTARRQRFRRSIPFGHVSKNGKLVLEIKNTELVYKNTV
ncbi:hypothetical protein [Alteromonas sp. KUL106]|uniref:hypothetical protein n=1 Tax=Alteromonas sp. KUL106 TaxID=2480799 RepID=UPI0012E6EED1|nr:hypothetical protein [Alteromonas sp. KUL106]GFD67923.1 hypothetical protein KUL106_11860 [Alteromonas sp. KUL106]